MRGASLVEVARLQFSLFAIRIAKYPDVSSILTVWWIFGGVPAKGYQLNAWLTRPISSIFYKVCITR